LIAAVAAGTAAAVGAQWTGVNVGRRIALRLNICAPPNPIVRGHRVPVPYLGGTGLFVAYIPAVALADVLGGVDDRWLWLQLIGAALMLVVGTVDDIVPLSPGVKLAAQIALCGAVIVALDHGSVLERVVLGIAAVGIVNAYNLIDVMDGLLCVVAGVGAAGLLAEDLPRGGGMSLALLVGGMAALFSFNRPPATVYAGDAGALTVGFVMATWVVELVSRGGAARAVPIAGTVAIPVLELLLVVVARLRVRKSPLRGSRDHFALRLQDQLGWSRWQVLAVTLPVAVIFGAGPLVAPSGSGVNGAWLAASLVLGLGTWIACWRLTPEPG
jgi:UDP-GlcNAc:undecaprenyl-phosphate GlcNAc-1-phosphate transferase